MKIRTAKDLVILDQKIKDELGIDVLKYKNEEIVENFIELLVFPAYVVSWVIRPILISILIFIIGFFLFDLVHIEYVIYGIVGLILFLLSGALFGVLFLTYKMKSDIGGIIIYSLDIMKSAVEDLNLVSGQISTENRKDVLGLLFKGITHIVTIPMMSKVISDKVPFVGGLVNGFIKKILTLVTDRVKFDEEKLSRELDKKEGESSALEIYSKSISSVSSGLEKVMNVTFGIAQFPLKLVFGIVFLILIFFLYLIN